MNFDPTSYTAEEGSDAVLIATLNSPAITEVTVQVRTEEGTATGWCTFLKLMACVVREGNSFFYFSPANISHKKK